MLCDQLDEILSTNDDKGWVYTLKISLRLQSFQWDFKISASLNIFT